MVESARQALAPQSTWPSRATPSRCWTRRPSRAAWPPAGAPRRAAPARPASRASGTRCARGRAGRAPAAAQPRTHQNLQRAGSLLAPGPRASQRAVPRRAGACDAAGVRAAVPQHLRAGARAGHPLALHALGAQRLLEPARAGDRGARARPPACMHSRRASAPAARQCSDSMKVSQTEKKRSKLYACLCMFKHYVKLSPAHALWP
jgi:hypothetical protein